MSQTDLAIERMVQRHGPSAPAVAIVATQAGVAGDVIDPLAIAALVEHEKPDEAADVKQAVNNLLVAYAELTS